MLSIKVDGLPAIYKFRVLAEDVTGFVDTNLKDIRVWAYSIFKPGQAIHMCSLTPSTELFEFDTEVEDLQGGRREEVDDLENHLKAEHEAGFTATKFIDDPSGRNISEPRMIEMPEGETMLNEYGVAAGSFLADAPQF